MFDFTESSTRRPWLWWGLVEKQESEREIGCYMGVIHGQLGGSGVESRWKLFPSSLPTDVIAGAAKDGSKKRWVMLPMEQGYGATCILASIDE